MQISLQLDAGGVIYFFYFGALSMVVSVILAITIEALLLWLSKWARLLGSLWQAFLINFVSLGLPVVLLLVSEPLRVGILWFSEPLSRGFVAFFLVTLVIEGGALALLRRGHSIRRALLTTLGINLASYASLALLFPFLSLMLMYLVTSLFPDQMSDPGSMPLMRLLLQPFFR